MNKMTFLQFTNVLLCEKTIANDLNVVLLYFFILCILFSQNLFGQAKACHRDGYKPLNELMQGVILWMRPANQRRRYIATLSLIGWAQTQNDPCLCLSSLLMYRHIRVIRSEQVGDVSQMLTITQLYQIDASAYHFHPTSACRHMDLDSELTGFIQPHQELSGHVSNMNTGDPLRMYDLDISIQGYFMYFWQG